ncbi:uncharacterized protein H6S33_012441 [Morchella sextelata]|uniref:uncharacterized protein n=1 Tax=Morchella sextelata TaxID=1174677 RepID=UPI001D05A96A|nr:uncharacterized protein H6S33_012441 [Morchella sextelata]KAH0609895.1 hypothetical protein H6S33_012441 [Morchella sextelata]
MTDYVDITGVTEGRNGPAVPLRTEINEFIQNKDMLNIYLLGLQRMQSLPKTDKLSWFQIGGIHGRPYAAWDSVSGISGNNSGYCTHSSILFPTWHRPYVALYEQALFANCKAAVQAFPEGPAKTKYMRLVPSFRIPYWDFAANQKLPDIVLRQEKVTVETPTGTKTINNPLYSYNFGTIDRREFPERQYYTWPATLRQPLIRGRAPAATDKSNPDQVQRGLDSNFKNIRDRMYALLTQNGYKDYKAFSNDGWVRNGRADDYDSLESIHNIIHGITGGDGHMGHPGYAAFDPIFWLHHCNVDRIFALWQVLNPNSYVTDQTAQFSTFWSNGSQQSNNPTVEGVNTGLLPFHKNDREYYTSQTCRELKQFGSTYPELIDWGVVGPTQVKQNVVAAVTRLYGTQAPAGRIAGSSSGTGIIAAAIAPFKAMAQQTVGIPQTDGPGDEDHAGHKHAEVHKSDTKKPFVPVAQGGHPSLLEDNHYHEYFADIRVDKYCLGGSFNVHVFMGDFNTDPVARMLDRNLVGTFNVFANDSDNTGCGKCKQNAEEGLIVTASIPLTGALLDRIPDNSIPELQSLEPDIVVPFLNKKLHWRVNRLDGTAVHREEVPSLKVAIATAIVDLPDHENDFPTYRAWRPLYDVTRGRTCGIVEGDDL